MNEKNIYVGADLSASVVARPWRALHTKNLVWGRALMLAMGKQLHLFSLVLLLTTSYFPLPALFADDAEVKLNSNDGSTNFVIQDNTGIIVSSVTSAGNAYFKGNVGIGTASPSSKLHLFGAVGSGEDGCLTLETDAAANAKWMLAPNYSTTNSFQIVYMADVSNPRLFIKSDGNVGIGTTNPGAKLHISGGGVRIDNMTTPGYIKNDASGNLLGGNSIAPEDIPSNLDAAKIANGTVNSAEFQYLDGATSSIQTQIDAKAPTASPAFTGTVSGITKTMVGLGSVDNTADIAKPVSAAQQTALNLKANLASPTFTGTVYGITSTMVGLGNVTNTSDVNKPVSTAQQTALDLKANLASPTFTGTVSMAGPLSAPWGLVFQHYEPGWGTNATKPYLRQQWSGAAGDYLYLGNTGNRSSTEESALVLAQNYIIFGKGSDASDGLSTEFMRIASNGNVGIGRTDPGYKLDVLSDIRIKSAYLGSSSLRFNTNYDYPAWNTAKIVVVDEGYEWRGSLAFYTHPSDAVGGEGTERLRINSNGNVGIGTTDPGTYKLYVAGTGYLGSSSWSYLSDKRLKENISYIQSGLDVVEQLKPVKFDYINGEKKQAGFIAQEVQKILPDIVTEGTNGMLGMKTDSIIPYLVKGMQEQQNAIKEQQKEIDDLKLEIEKLKK